MKTLSKGNLVDSDLCIAWTLLFGGGGRCNVAVSLHGLYVGGPSLVFLSIRAQIGSGVFTSSVDVP